MDSSYIFAAFFWGTVGFGFFMFGKKQKSIVPLVGGIILMGISYVIRTALNLSLISIAIIVALYVANRKM